MDAFRKAVFNQSEMQTLFEGTKRFRRKLIVYKLPIIKFSVARPTVVPNWRDKPLISSAPCHSAGASCLQCFWEYVLKPTPPAAADRGNKRHPHTSLWAANTMRGCLHCTLHPSHIDTTAALHNPVLPCPWNTVTKHNSFTPRLFALIDVGDARSIPCCID